MITISCSTRCFPQESLDRALVRVAWAGFRGAELAWRKSAESPPAEPAEGPSVESLAARLEAEELEPVAVDAGEITFATEEETLTAMAHIGRRALLARDLGAPLVVFATGPREDGRFDALVADLNRLLKVLDAVPVSLAVCHRADSLVAVPAEFQALYEQLDSPRLVLALDPAEALRAGWAPTSVLETLLPGHVYLTDLRNGEQAAIGAGDADWEALAAELVRRGYHGAVSLLPDGGDPVFAENDARAACAYAKELFGHAD